MIIINYNKRIFYNRYIEKINLSFEKALELLKVPYKELEVNLFFVSKKEIQELNRKFRNKDSVTDVLSFPNLLKENSGIIASSISKENFKFDINPENNAIFLGDISICTKVVLKNAKKFGNTPLREMTYMAVHGLLHLLGYDHMEKEDKKTMREMEEKILSQINIVRG